MSMFFFDRDGRGGAVRQGQEDDVVPGEDLGGRRLDDAAGQRREVRLVLPEEVADAGVARERADGDLRVLQEEAQDLAARVARALRDGIGSMPSYKATLKEEDINALALYVSKASKAP